MDDIARRKDALKQLREMKSGFSEMRLAAEEWDDPWKCLISTLMSARTRDEVTIPIAAKLFEKYPTVNDLANARVKDVERIIRPVNFYRNKSRHVVACAKAIVERHDGSVPLEFDKLIELPGVGRKTANVFLSEMGHDEIGVDTHVSYISQRMGWTESKHPHKIEADLKRLFPRSRWKDINSILVRFGKTHTSRRKKDEEIDRIRKLGSERK